MKCHQCGSELAKIATNLPFKIDLHSLIIIKDLPVLQCRNCGEYLIEDAVMVRVDAILKNIGTDVEVEILSYAA